MHYREAAYSAFPEFSSRAAEFAVFHWEHMRLEEDELIPLARLHLTGADWDAIDAAFLGHTDPLLGAERSLPRVYSPTTRAIARAYHVYLQKLRP